MVGRKQLEKTIFTCQECGHQSGRWFGRCPACGQWESLVEQRRPAGDSRRPASPAGAPLPLTSAPDQDSERVVIGITEMDRVLGGGIVPG
ncbi:MAG: DNA repair protein RadA, partial [Desulfofustis sp.]|nr:DNA repair protein RadA [Desulfofustis sp.]